MKQMMRKVALAGIALVAVTAYDYYKKNFGSESHNSPVSTSSSTASNQRSPFVDNRADILAKIKKSAQNQTSGWWMSAEGTVIKNLKDDTKGHQHQKFLLKLSSDITLLVAHNIDLAPRAPIRQGDRIKIRGRYEWNNRGGVLHWTHHDPKGRKKGGWIYHNNKFYK